jgi:hypothetical protein
MVLSYLQHLGEQLGGWLYLIAGALTFGEAAVLVGLVFPAEAALLTAGFAAHHGWIALGPMIAVAVGAAAAGDSVGYETGRVLGPRLQQSRLGRRIGRRRWTATEKFLARHGGKAVLLGRFTRSPPLTPAGTRAAAPGTDRHQPAGVGSQERCPASAAKPTKAAASMSVWATTSGCTRPQRWYSRPKTRPMTTLPVNPPMPW